MSGLTPKEKNAIIDQMHGLVESLREDPHGIEIRGCREAVGALLGVGLVLLVLYVFLSLGELVGPVPIGILLSIAGAFLGLYLLVRATP